MRRAERSIEEVNQRRRGFNSERNEYCRRLGIHNDEIARRRMTHSPLTRYDVRPCHPCRWFIFAPRGGLFLHHGAETNHGLDAPTLSVHRWYPFRGLPNGSYYSDCIILIALLTLHSASASTVLIPTGFFPACFLQLAYGMRLANTTQTRGEDREPKQHELL